MAEILPVVVPIHAEPLSLALMAGRIQEHERIVRCKEYAGTSVCFPTHADDAAWLPGVGGVHTGVKVLLRML